MCVDGICGKHTSFKQLFFSKFIEHHINVINNVESRFKPYLYIDPFGGPGHISCKDGYDGPVSSVRVGQLMIQYNMNYNIVVAEKNLTSAEKLKDALGQYCSNFTIKSDAMETIPSHDNYRFGMMYLDPPMTKDSFSLVEELMVQTSLMMPRLDLLLYIGANWIKRFRGNSNVEFSTFLEDFTNKVNKEFWVIKQQVGGNQYTFLAGTNYKGWAEWGKEYFYSTDDIRGKKIMFRLNYSEPERLFITTGMVQKGF